MTEVFAQYYEGGPRGGEVDWVDGPWPLPVRVGEYAKADESRLEHGTPPYLIRGALYRVAALRPVGHGDDGVCLTCGGMTVRTGTCHTCTECGSTSGCG